MPLSAGALEYEEEIALMCVVFTAKKRDGERTIDSANPRAEEDGGDEC